MEWYFLDQTIYLVSVQFEEVLV